jgi:hypothetical protein
MVDSVLKDARERTIVFGGDEKQTLRGSDLSFQPFDRERLIGIIILIVEREVADLRMLEREFGRSKLRDRLGEPGVKGIVSQAAHDDCNVDLTHGLSFG